MQTQIHRRLCGEVTDDWQRFSDVSVSDLGSVTLRSDFAMAPRDWAPDSWRINEKKTKKTHEDITLIRHEENEVFNAELNVYEVPIGWPCFHRVQLLVKFHS